MAKQKVNFDGWFNHGVDLTNRILYLGSVENLHDGEPGVDFKMAEAAIKGLIALDLSGKGTVTIILNTFGGSEQHGLAIYDAIKNCNSPVQIMAFGAVMSMGAVILQAADKRILAPNVTFMMHYGTFGMENHTKIVYQWAKEGKRRDRWMEEMFLEKIHKKHPRFTQKRLRELLNFDTILSAQETIDLGLADAVLGVKK